MEGDQMDVLPGIIIGMKIVVGDFDHLRLVFGLKDTRTACPKCRSNLFWLG